MIPFITSRSSTWRLLPPRLAGGINGSISAHSSSVRSLGYRNALRSYRPRFFDVHIGDPPRIRSPLLNHKRLTGFNMFSDRHLVLLCHKFWCPFRAAQHGQRESVVARAATNLRRIVAIEFGTWRSGRNGGSSGLVTFA